MTGAMPFLLSDTNYRLRVPFDDVMYVFDVRWNSRDAAHYINILQDDDTPIALGVKLVLGVNLARRVLHPLLSRFIFTMVDTENSGIDAAFDDLGRRVHMQVSDENDIARLNSLGIRDNA